jgi:NAD-dependent deacetylase
MPLSPQDTEKINAIAATLKQCNSILFITGAGISADSGLPTYRGIGGLYNDKTTEEGIPIEVAISGEMMRKNPTLVWKHIYQIEAACRRAKFNRGHEVIAEIENSFERVWTLTQNIDGFHRDAGSKNIIDIHGDIHQLVCISCGRRSRVKDFSNLKIPPFCPDCSNLVRPEVVLFGEMLPEDKYRLLADELRKGFDIIFSVGTTSVFPYIAQPVIEARHRQIPTVEINPSQTQVSGIVDIKIAAGAAETLDAIWKKYQDSVAVDRNIQ